MAEKKTVRVPRFSTSGTGSERTSHAAVSMPLAPWDKKGSPKRIQMTRQRPWRQDNPDAVIVARGSKNGLGNPYIVGTHGTADQCVSRYRQALTGLIDNISQPAPPYADIVALQTAWAANRHALRGKDLACWCPLDQACHADVLLELANEVPG